MKTSCSYCDKYQGKYPPRNGCTQCWAIYFHVNPVQSNAIRYAIENFGRAVAVKTKGEVFVKMFEVYRSNL